MAGPAPATFKTSTVQLPWTPENGTTRRRRKSGESGGDICGGASLKADVVSIPSSKTSSKGHARQLSTRKKSSKRKKSRSFLHYSKDLAVKRTWAIPLLFLLAFLSLYAINPTESNIVQRFIFLSYKQQSLEAGADSSAPPHYGKGPWDIAFVAFYTIVLSFTREFIMQELLRPLARLGGIRSRGKQLRFMEQMYTAIYFANTGLAGIYIMRGTPVWYFNTRGMYEFFPHKILPATFKFYYLFQAAYWTQQAIVMLLGMEKRRKDFKELVAHHIVTLALIALSYRFHFTYMGLAVYLTHDISDLFLAISKSLHYIHSPLAGPHFGVSIVAWIYLRHYLNLRIIISLFTEFKTVGPYELNWETQQYKCLLSNVITFSLLVTLQALNIFWLFCLLRSAYRLVVHRIEKDDRSEAEESELEEMETQKGGEKVEGLLLLNADGFCNGIVSGAMDNGNAAHSTCRKMKGAM